MASLSENMAALQGILGAQQQGFTQSRARAMAPEREAMEREKFRQNQLINQLKIQEAQQALPLQQQLLQSKVEALPIQRQLDQLKLQKLEQQLQTGRQGIAEADRQSKIRDVIAIGNIAEQVKAQNIEDPQERLNFARGLMSQAGYEGIIRPGDESIDKLNMAIAARDSLIKRDPSLTGRKLTATEKDWKRYQELKKTDPEGAKQYGIATGFLSKEGKELSVHLQKRLSAANDAAREARSNVVEFRSLADQFDKSGITGGMFSKWAESLKSFTGNQDAKTALRERFFAVRGSEVMDSLPPGAASDIDVKNAMKGFPDDTANGKTIASFLRGLAKMEEASDRYNTFVAEYISDPNNRGERGLLKAWRESVGLDKSSKDTTTDNLSNLSDEELMRQIQALEGNQ